MSDAADTPERPAPYWLHACAILTVACATVLLILGQLVTSFRAGMADPIWPTEPWYLLSNYKLDLGYLIEHTHRIAGFAVGIVISVLALGLWWSTPNAAARVVGAAALVALLAGFGEFHRALMAQREPGVPVVLPVLPVALMGGALGVVMIAGLGGVVARAPGAGLRLLGVVGLVAVMVQGLFGGFRVKLNELAGTDLAAVHGVFGQLVFALLVALAVLTARRPSTALPHEVKRPLTGLSFALTSLLFIQLIFGALVRHAPTSLNQRLHILMAFLVLAHGVWLLRISFNPLAKERIGLAARLLAVLLTLQVTLGVEAWMGKFGDEARGGRSSQTYLPEAAEVTKKQASIRTSHALIGTGVLAVTVALLLRVRVRPSTAGAGAAGGNSSPFVGAQRSEGGATP